MSIIPEVSIIDYGLGNLKSICKALEFSSVSYNIIDQPEYLLAANRLILPGVGAFGDGIKGLESRGLIDPIKEKAQNGTPLLGICLGMQLLCSESYEFGHHQGLDLVKGKVIPFKSPSEHSDPRYKVPHIGWNSLLQKEDNKKNLWNGHLLKGIAYASDVYFVHSFYAELKDSTEVISISRYGEEKFCALFERDTIMGAQFHPEKSGSVGLKIINNFMQCKTEI